jgi:hypothetical protein
MVGAGFNVLFFRHPKFVRFMYGIPMGFGLGQAWTESKLLFEHDVKFDRCLIATVKPISS